MSIKNNGRKRDFKYILGSIFLLGVGLLCLYLAVSSGWKIAWTLTTIAVFYLSFAMFRNANEI
jgi:hypothetical protein